MNQPQAQNQNTLTLTPQIAWNNLAHIAELPALLLSAQNHRAIAESLQLLQALINQQPVIAARVVELEAKVAELEATLQPAVAATEPAPAATQH